MVALQRIIAAKNSDAAGADCHECLGAGTISHWSDVAFFEDRRVCTKCDAGCAVESRISDIVRRAQLEGRLLPR